mmetsp:Transcript_12205/g.35060  ORF Transcript_12205/g.35060 Transcript_12205/m.35060 type:complete len:232 (+) Transcript_12205:160-855(+)|eukprot:CAMPEP_0176124370 /NCGR_PEP_ID=MMETSP0120_2-20121206/62705_1 /TAXON_ID=160619 /ORGANISM="Kryptoperidinium foliaceum, Strain CCMP 1326" /LENGTH=231 /DNA_ID=CAMNT_0017459143 /DNA_START=157 /DNA_END=852 /DNA_ORIENTATION=+
MKHRSFLPILCQAIVLLSNAASIQGLQLPFFQPSKPTLPVASDLLNELQSCIQQAPKNGIDTPPELEAEIVDLCERLEKCNPTPRPVRNVEKMNGFWRMLWTNFRPVAPSSGKLGPFVGDVYQDVDFSGKARNILSIDFPPIKGELVAEPAVLNDSTMAITFETVGNKLAGVLPLGPKINFEPNKEVRLWEHVYLDDKYRILYARRREDTATRGFLYVMERADEMRFETGV